MALILYRVMRMRLTAAKRSESPAALLEQLKRIHQQTVQTMKSTTYVQEVSNLRCLLPAFDSDLRL